MVKKLLITHFQQMFCSNHEKLVLSLDVLHLSWCRVYSILIYEILSKQLIQFNLDTRGLACELFVIFKYENLLFSFISLGKFLRDRLILWGSNCHSPRNGSYRSLFLRCNWNLIWFNMTFRSLLSLLGFEPLLHLFSVYA